MKRVAKWARKRRGKADLNPAEGSTDPGNAQSHFLSSDPKPNRERRDPPALPTRRCSSASPPPLPPPRGSCRPHTSVQLDLPELGYTMMDDEDYDDREYETIDPFSQSTGSFTWPLGPNGRQSLAFDLSASGSGFRFKSVRRANPLCERTPESPEPVYERRLPAAEAKPQVIYSAAPAELEPDRSAPAEPELYSCVALSPTTTVAPAQLSSTRPRRQYCRLRRAQSAGDLNKDPRRGYSKLSRNERSRTGYCRLELAAFGPPHSAPTRRGSTTSPPPLPPPRRCGPSAGCYETPQVARLGDSGSVYARLDRVPPRAATGGYEAARVAHLDGPGPDIDDIGVCPPELPPRARPAAGAARQGRLRYVQLNRPMDTCAPGRAGGISTASCYETPHIACRTAVECST